MIYKYYQILIFKMMQTMDSNVLYMSLFSEGGARREVGIHCNMQTVWVFF